MTKTPVPYNAVLITDLFSPRYRVKVPIPVTLERSRNGRGKFDGWWACVEAIETRAWEFTREGALKKLVPRIRELYEELTAESPAEMGTPRTKWLAWLREHIERVGEE